ncbi:hypothetical protein AVEN_231029-1 [Araneus ventricosus]|uniref:Endonuclease/exonuclease/phosphatase domain-containing protein n=1 Tax=Araneus ventricosus TaxID=182803 RepID=A0A4Y2A3Y9_ARAVE|nr:hypothetical protein AVEN_231029-1 [Araneus ventricosus]
MPSIDIKRNDTPLCVITTKLSYLEPRSTTKFKLTTSRNYSFGLGDFCLNDDDISSQGEILRYVIDFNIVTSEVNYHREDTNKLGSKIVDLKSTIAELDITSLNSKVKDLEKQIAFTEGKLAEADKVNAIISEGERNASRTRIVDPQKTCPLVIRPKVNFSIKTKYGANWIISVEPSIYAAIKKGRGCSLNGVSIVLMTSTWSDTVADVVALGIPKLNVEKLPGALNVGTIMPLKIVIKLSELTIKLTMLGPCLNKDLDIVLGHNTNHIVGLFVKLGVLELQIISAYFPLHDSIDSLTEEFTNFNSINKNVLILGDFNARSLIYNCNFEDIRGRAIIDFSTMNDLLNCNNKHSPPTFVSHSGRGWPDLTFANSIFNFIKKWEVVDLESLGDYRSISVQLDFDVPNINDFYFKTTYNKPKFVKNFQKLLPDLHSKLKNVKDRVSLDLFFKFFVDSVSECAYKSYRKSYRRKVDFRGSFLSRILNLEL